MSFYSSRWIKATRKPHHCGWCGTRIEAGSAANYASGIFEGEFCASHFHPECRAAQDSLSSSELLEGWTPGDWARGRTDDENLPPQFSADYRGKEEARQRREAQLPV